MSASSVLILYGLIRPQAHFLILGPKDGKTRLFFWGVELFALKRIPETYLFLIRLSAELFSQKNIRQIL